jgi:hypothetical protein
MGPVIRDHLFTPMGERKEMSRLFDEGKCLNPNKYIHPALLPIEPAIAGARGSKPKITEVRIQ